jgi:hypothetical protein
VNTHFIHFSNDSISKTNCWLKFKLKWNTCFSSVSKLFLYVCSDVRTSYIAWKKEQYSSQTTHRSSSTISFSITFGMSLSDQLAKYITIRSWNSITHVDQTASVSMWLWEAEHIYAHIYICNYNELNASGSTIHIWLEAMFCVLWAALCKHTRYIVEELSLLRNVHR